MSDGEDLEALQHLRTGSDPAELSSALRNRGIALSRASIDRADLPPEQLSLEFELMMKHPIAYPIGSSVQPPSMDLEILDVTNPAATIYENRTQPYVSPFGVRQQLGCMGSVASSIMGLSPPSELFNSRLLSVDIFIWTNHPLMPLFDVDLFLEGVLGNNQFCSCLLINALFAWASLKYATVDPEAAAIGYAFYEESKKLWARDKETTSTTICTMAALQYMSVTAFTFGAEAEQERYLGEMSDMAEILELFGTDLMVPQSTDIGNDWPWQLATTQMAWAVFNCLTYVNTMQHYIH
ncbi:hypothetical protein LZ31DRAFT_593595 [Colletotrichum somersetense]|nr:hypothetical protein LZ31DRAFT_593595 [Colletotrichum somersetense]